MIPNCYLVEAWRRLSAASLMEQSFKMIFVSVAKAALRGPLLVSSMTGCHGLFEIVEFVPFDLYFALR